VFSKGAHLVRLRREDRQRALRLAGAKQHETRMAAANTGVSVVPQMAVDKREGCCFILVELMPIADPYAFRSPTRAPVVRSG
jgi:hypothetical protein